MLRRTVISVLAPEISVSCQILVLGSMPGAISQKEAEYYAHPRNLFWDCVETAFQIDRNAPYQARLAALNDAHIGLWDVLASCSCKASSDATIRVEKSIILYDYCQPIPRLIEFVWVATRPFIIGVV